MLKSSSVLSNPAVQWEENDSMERWVWWMRCRSKAAPARSVCQRLCKAHPTIHGLQRFIIGAEGGGWRLWRTGCWVLPRVRESNCHVNLARSTRLSAAGRANHIRPVSRASIRDLKMSPHCDNWTARLLCTACSWAKSSEAYV